MISYNYLSPHYAVINQPINLVYFNIYDIFIIKGFRTYSDFFLEKKSYIQQLCEDT